MARFRSWKASTLLASCLACLAFVMAGQADEPGFTPIFNGTDLTGWEGDKAIWSVQDGAITGITTDDKKLPYNKFLIWRGGKPKNFELKAKVKLIGNSNSGIQYRSKQLPDAGEFVVAGYQADIHPDPNNNAMLYEERGRGILAMNGQKIVITEKGEKIEVAPRVKPKPIKLDEWNDYTIIAQGNHLIEQVNGVTTIDVVDHQVDKRALEGILAIQVHVGPAMKIQVKDILLKTLPDGGILTPAETPIPESAKKTVSAPPKAKAKAARPKMAQGLAPPATAASKLKGLKDFKVELVYAVPRESEGSWVNMTTDPKGRLIVSDQYGKLYRVTPPAIGGDVKTTKVEPIPAEIGEAQGLLWAFDSLYVVVNQGGRYRSGLYRVTDTNKDDTLDKVELLRPLNGGGEHGPHAVVLSPDGKSLYVIAGNATQLPEISSSLVPRTWGEDNLLLRMVDGNRFMADEKAPGGWICKVDPDGKSWELVSMGYRNPFDMAFNRAGELFTYDADMEWDVNMPWYRPTRICQSTSGSEFGYRNGAGKWPTYYFDSLPPVVDIGPGSPTGVSFGYGAKFPVKYQDAYYICDWSYGKLYALHVKPDGAGYKADVEEFISGTPLPLTDLVVNPSDGALYFAVGGRRTTSALYRVTYTGTESTAPATVPDSGVEARALRKSLEVFHGHKDPKAVEKAWPYLGHPDRFIRWAARIAIEFQDPEAWREKALSESDAKTALPALLALIHVSAPDPAHRKPADPPVDPALEGAILQSLDRLGWSELSHEHRLDLLRVAQVLMNRYGKPNSDTVSAIISRLDPLYPAKSRDMNVELAQLLVYLEAPDAASKTVKLLEQAPTQEEQIEYARALRVLKTGWTPALRKSYFSWFPKAATFSGGNSFRGFMKNIKDDAIANLSESEKAEYKPIYDAVPDRKPMTIAANRKFVKNWSLEELAPVVESGLHGRDFDRGRSLFAETACFACHRFSNEGGGAGPDLSGVAGRFSAHDLLESIIKPSKVISDQYGAVTISTTDGQIVTGRIVNLNGDSININTNMLDPNLQVGIDRKKIEETRPSTVSMMPEGLLNTLSREEVLDLMAYLLSRGDRNAEMFKKP